MAGAYEMTGRVKAVFAPVSFASGFTKREFVLTLEDEYPQDVKFVCVKEKGALLDAVAAGSRVKVLFRIRGNEHKERYYVDLQAFHIDALAAEAGAAPPPAPAGAAGPAGPADAALPF